MAEYKLVKGDVAYTTGAYIEWTGTEWRIVSIEDDTYFGIHLVEDKMNEPYVSI